MNLEDKFEIVISKKIQYVFWDIRKTNSFIMQGKSRNDIYIYFAKIYSFSAGRYYYVHQRFDSSDLCQWITTCNHLYASKQFSMLSYVALSASLVKNFVSSFYINTLVFSSIHRHKTWIKVTITRTGGIVRSCKLEARLRIIHLFHNTKNRFQLIWKWFNWELRQWVLLIYFFQTQKRYRL